MSNLKPKRTRRDYSAEELARIGTAEQSENAHGTANPGSQEAHSARPETAMSSSPARPDSSILPSGTDMRAAAPRQQAVTKTVRLSPECVAMMRELSVAIETSENKFAARLLEPLVRDLYRIYEESGSTAVFDELKRRTK